MLLPIPPEPKEIKSWMKALDEGSPASSSINQDASVVWAGNKLPKYLWDFWKADLKPIGFTWQKFMQVLRYRTDVGVMWYKGTISWEEFIKKVAALIKGPIGKSVGENKSEVAPLDLGRWQFPAISDWQAFERLCKDLWSAIWNDPEAHLNGRMGQAQAGVDVWGRINQDATKVGGVQCKRRDAYAADSLTEEELKKIVEAAKQFSPKLTRLVIAFTGKSDVKLQEAARKISAKNLQAGLFEVDVFAWDEIVNLLGSYPDIAVKYLDSLQTDVSEGKLKDLDRKMEAVLDQQTDISVNISEIKNKMAASPEIPNRVILDAIQTTADTSAVTQEYNAELDHAKQLIDTFKAKEALDYLEELEKRIPATVGKIVRFRLLTNKAAAQAIMGENTIAGQLFIEAYQYNPDDEKALCNMAVGHILLDQKADAKPYIAKVLEKNSANQRAYELMLHAADPTESLDQLIEKIPKALRETSGVAYAIANVAREREDLETSTHWLEIAVKNGKGRKEPDLFGNLAANILSSFSGKAEVLSGAQLTPADKEKLERAIHLLTEAINALQNTETINSRASWFINRSSAYKLLGRLEESYADIEAGIKLDPKNPMFLKQKSFVLYERKEVEPAIALMREVLDEPTVPEAALILAGMLQEKGDMEGATKVLTDSLARDIPAEIRNEERRILLQIYCETNDLAKARETSAAMRADNPTSVLNLVDAARVERLAKDEGAASKLLEEAKNYVSGTTPSSHIIQLANEFYFTERYADAWPLFEKIVDVRVDSTLANRLLYSYYRAGETEKGLAACRSIPEESKSRSAAEIEIAFLGEANDLKQAASVAEKYLAVHPDDLQMKVRLALTLYRLEDFGKLDVFLNSDIDIASLPVDVGFQLVGLCGERGMSQKSLQLAYELRRKYFNVGEAHLKYVGVFFSREKALDDWLMAREVAPDTSVRIEDGGVPRLYILEDRKDPAAASGELSLNDSLAKKLIGKKVGDEVVISKTEISEVKVKVVEIKSKYVHALHESLEILPQRFPDTQGLQRMSVPIGEGPEAVKEQFTGFLDQVGRRDKWISEAEQLYLTNQITIGTFANLLEKNVIDVWEGLWGGRTVNCCIGTPDERERGLSLLKENKPVAIDITALMTCAELDILDLVKKVIPDPLVAQSTIDLLQEAISDRKGMSSGGFMSVWKEKDGYRRREVTTEDIEKDIKFLEGIKKWAKESARVVPCKTAPQLDRERRKELEKMIGASFLETILIAKENNGGLYSDDSATKMFAFNEEYKVSGTWTQALLIHAVNEKLITEEEYHKFTIRLIRMKYKHTTISAATLIEAARQAEWLNKMPFLAVTETLSGAQGEIRSIVGVSVEFMFLLWKQPILDFQKENLIMGILDAITDCRKKDQVFAILEIVLKARFKLLPLAEKRIHQIMMAWRALHV